jgi:hypothetical protein
MRTTTLDVSQWLICTAVALSIVVPPRSQSSAATGRCPSLTVLRFSGASAPSRVRAFASSTVR